MRLSRLYTNQPAVFAPVEFNDAVNVVLAEIRVPANRNRDTHNLGKTTLGQVIDFCLLASRKSNFFLFRHLDRFKGFVFFLEIETLDGRYITVRRDVAEATRIAFKHHREGRRDFRELPAAEWDHVDVPFEKAKELLDGILNLQALKPWDYRKVAGYLLRSQDDFREVFHLKKFASKHAEWKPFLAHLLGFADPIIVDHYAKEAELEEKRAEEEFIKQELGGSIEDLSKIEGMLQLKQAQADKRQELLDSFDFRALDKQKTKRVVDDLDGRIADLNTERYSLAHTKKRISSSLEADQILFDPSKASALFEEAGVLFGGQLKKDFVQLIAFNRAITEERRGYLEEELRDVDISLKRVNAELDKASRERAGNLAFLKGDDIFARYKQGTDELVGLKADIAALKRQQEAVERLQRVRAVIHSLYEEKERLAAKIEADVAEQNRERGSRFSAIRLFFNEIVQEVIDRQALLTVSTNSQGHLEFRAEIIDETGNATSADRGTSYRKLLCVAFDLAVARAHLASRYPRFVFHDGVFETLDPRKKAKLLQVVRNYAALGIQHVITLIDADTPVPENGKAPFDDEEVIVRLHDEDDSGRLFKMSPW